MAKKNDAIGMKTKNSSSNNTLSIGELNRKTKAFGMTIPPKVEAAQPKGKKEKK